MAFELERKFHLKSIPEDAQRLLTRDKAQTLRQGYLSSNPTIRVRIDSSRSLAWLTVKGKRTAEGKPEFEYKIPRDDASQLMLMCGRNVLDKIRGEETVYKSRLPLAVVAYDVFPGIIDSTTGRPLVLAEIEKCPAADLEDFNNIYMSWMDNAVEVTAKKGWSNRSIAKNHCVPSLF